MSGDPSHSRRRGPTLTVATYNLYVGADLSRLFAVGDAAGLARAVTEVRAELDATCFPERAGALADVLVRERPELVGLQEVARWTSRRGDGRAQVLADFLPALTAALAARGCRYDTCAVAPAFGGMLPVEDAWMELSGADVVLVRADAAVDVAAVSTGTYAARHHVDTGLPGARFPIARGWSRVQASVAGRPLTFVATHLEAWDARVRAAQRDELLDAVGDPGHPVVVVGDFNANPSEVGMPADYHDAWLEAGGDADGGATCGQAGDLRNPVSRLGQRIDYVWVRGAGVTGCRVAGDRPGDRTLEHGMWPSDHAAVVADLVLPPV